MCIQTCADPASILKNFTYLEFGILTWQILTIFFGFVIWHCLVNLTNNRTSDFLMSAIFHIRFTNILSYFFLAFTVNCISCTMLRLKMFAAFTGISSNIFQRKQFCILNSVLNLLIIASLSKMLPMLHKGLKA